MTMPFADATSEQRAAKYPDGSYVFGPPLMCTDSDHVVIKRDDLSVVLACLAEDLGSEGWLKSVDDDHDGGRRRVLEVRRRLEITHYGASER